MFYQDDYQNPNQNQNQPINNFNNLNNNNQPEPFFHYANEVVPQRRNRPFQQENPTPSTRDSDSMILGVIFRYQDQLKEFLQGRLEAKVSALDRRMTQIENGQARQQNQGQNQGQNPGQFTEDKFSAKDRENIKKNFESIKKLQENMNSKADDEALKQLEHNLNTLIAELKLKGLIK